jgi:hypothetical protein
MPGYWWSGKNVGELPFELFEHGGAAVHGHGLALEEVIRPDVVHAGRVVLVFVRKQEGVQRLDPFAQHLLPEVGSRVDHEAFVADLQVHRNAQPLVAEVQRTAHLAFAGNDGNALRRAGAEKGNNHAGWDLVISWYSFWLLSPSVPCSTEWNAECPRGS